jgi:hypothetical protein
MKNVSLLLAGLVLVVSAAPALAIPPFNDAFKKIYVKAGEPLEAKVMEVKCNVCHVGKEKKDKNDYGKTVAKYLKKVDFTGEAKKFDDIKGDAAQKALAEGLAKAGAEKSASGKTYDELLKSGELPAK